MPKNDGTELNNLINYITKGLRCKVSDYINRSLDNLWKVAALDEYMIGHKGFIAGGCFKNLFNGEKIKDVDMFFENSIDYMNAESYYDKNEDYSFYYESKKVKAYKCKKTNVTVELIYSVYGTPQEIIDSFDFTIVKIAYFKQETPMEDVVLEGEGGTEYRILHHKDLFEHLFFKRLVIDSDLKFPNSSFERALKYKGYGYGLCRESKLKLIEAIKANLNPSDKLTESLYDGVD